VPLSVPEMQYTAGLRSHTGALVFRCQKINKKNRIRCDTRVSILKLTYFDNVHLNLTVIAEIVLLHLTRPPSRCQFIAKETNVSHRILIDYFNFIREVLVFWAHNNSEQIGGEGKIVEIDEAKIGKRKYNKGRYLEGQWVFGGIERGSNKFFLVAVEDRTANTLVGIVKDKIKPGTTIYSDCWKSYETLTAEHFDHLTVNHSVNFVDPQTGAHTQHIERTWVEVRKLVPCFGRKKIHYEGYLSECLFFCKFRDHRVRLHEFWKLASEMYPGLPH
jgi:transposase-like protein